MARDDDLEAEVKAQTDAIEAILRAAYTPRTTLPMLKREIARIVAEMRQRLDEERHAEIIRVQTDEPRFSVGGQPLIWDISVMRKRGICTIIGTVEAKSREEAERRVKRRFPKEADLIVSKRGV